MAKCYGYICDICGEFVHNRENRFRFKAKSGIFPYYISCDICIKCAQEFEEWVNLKKDKSCKESK